MTNESEDIQAVQRLGEARDKIVTELRKTIVGMNSLGPSLLDHTYPRMALRRKNLPE
jgi:hypothetical protein